MIWQNKSSVLKIICSVLVFKVVLGDDGLCGVEPPKEGESCSGSASTPEFSKKTEEVYERVVFKDYPEEEKEIWDKRFYSKLSYTTKYDWPIRDLLDEAEDYIANDAKTAIEKINKILEEYPDSPRAQYDLVRAIQYHFYEKERDMMLTDAERHEHTLDLIQRFVNIMTQFRPIEMNEVEEEDEVQEGTEEMTFMEYVQPPSIFGSAVQQALIECDNMNLTELSAEITEKAFDINPNFAASERYHILLIQKYYVMDDLVAMETAVERASMRFPDSILLKFLHGILLKKLHKKKEGNAMLREVEFEGESATQFADEMRQLGNNLYNRGKVSQAHELFRETSKTHGFLSLFQRPVMSVPDLEATPLWNPEDQVSLTKHEEEFQTISSKWKIIKEEAVRVASNMSEGWLFHVKTLNEANLIIGEGNWTVYPIFAWGKRKAFACSKAPSTCDTIKDDFPLAADFTLGVAKFEHMFGKTRTIPHCGPVNTRLRMILPLQVPKDSFKYRIGKDTMVPFVEGQIVVIDDSFEHEMINESDESVIWLSVDFPHPDLAFGADKKTSLSAFAKRHFIGI